MYLLKTLLERWQVKPPASVSDCIKDATLLLAQQTERNYHPKGLEDLIQFGKHKGLKVWQIIDKDPNYLCWCMDNISGFQLKEESHNYLIEKENQNVKNY